MKSPRAVNRQGVNPNNKLIINLGFFKIPISTVTWEQFISMIIQQENPTYSDQIALLITVFIFLWTATLEKKNYTTHLPIGLTCPLVLISFFLKKKPHTEGMINFTRKKTMQDIQSSYENRIE